MQKKNNGFTLIEILIALVIFAIMGVLAAMSLQSMIRSHALLKKTNHQILQLQITMTLLRRDISQAINRPVRIAAIKVPAFIATHNQITFTKTGLFNPLQFARQSNMQRVGYALQKDKLIRLTWTVLDTANNNAPEQQTVLNNVTSLQWQFITNLNTKSSTWPPATITDAAGSALSPLPKAVLLVMHIQHEGIVQGVFPLPARGTNETP